MLILVIVTISFAMNGGLFQKAKEGTEKTQVEILKEQAEVAKAEAYAEYVQNGETYNAGTVATAIAREVGGTASGNYVTVVTSAGIYYIIVGNDTNITVTTVEPIVAEGFPDEYFSRCYKRLDGLYTFTFINNGGNITAYAIDVEYDNAIDKTRTVEKVTYSSMIETLDATGIEYNLELSNTDAEVFAETTNEPDEGEFFVFYDNYTKFAAVFYYIDEDEGEEYAGIDDRYALQPADFLDISEIIN